MIILYLHKNPPFIHLSLLCSPLVPPPEDGVSPGVQLAFASILGTAPVPASSEEEEEDSLSFRDDEDDEDYKVEEEEEEERAKVQVLGKRGRRRSGKKRKRRGMMDMEEEGEKDDMLVGDVFALEMELTRENKKMMKVSGCFCRCGDAMCHPFHHGDSRLLCRRGADAASCPARCGG